MEFLLNVIVVGMAVGYVTEFISGLLSKWMSSSATKRLTTLPLSALFLWILGTEFTSLIVGVPAAGFFALVILSFINRPVLINSGNRRV
jgi:hypothetical protein